MHLTSNVVLIWSSAFIGLTFYMFSVVHQMRVELHLANYKIGQLEQRVVKAEGIIPDYGGTGGAKNDVQERHLEVLENSPFKIDHERLENFFSMANVPSAVRIWYTFSQTVASKLDVLEGNHPEVINYLRKYKLIPPPMFQTAAKPVDKSWRKNAQDLVYIFKKKKHGFFVECGAYDGHYMSNTYYLERLLGWQGLLIEAEPYNFEQLVTRLRNAFLTPACLSSSTKPQMSAFPMKTHIFGKIDSDMKMQHTVQVQCFPLYSILLALNRTTIDFFSLDIEGHELDILKTIPFDKIDIKVILVEFLHIKEGKRALENFMASKGYVAYDKSGTFAWSSEDQIFVKSGCGYNEEQPA